jgi:RHS repeat-associated protein
MGQAGAAIRGDLHEWAVGDAVFLRHHGAVAGDVRSHLRDHEPAAGRRAGGPVFRQPAAGAGGPAGERANNISGGIAYYPWGEERTSTSDGTFKFATYFRDVVSNGIPEDYANARYYNNNFGRFWSVDPGGAKAADPKNPQSWNRYAYTNDDPVNFSDPSGSWLCPVGYGEGLQMVGCSVITFAWGIMSQDPGPHGGGGGFHRFTLDPVSDKEARDLLSQAFKNFSGSHCAQVFSDVFSAAAKKSTSISTSSWTINGYESMEWNTEFYSATDPSDSILTQNQVTDNGDNTQLGSTLQTGEEARTIAGGTAYPAVLLGPNFFSNSSPVFQSDVLLHELIHALTGWSDPDIFNNFQNYGLQNVGNGSESISAWISTDCNSTPAANSKWWTNGTVP